MEQWQATCVLKVSQTQGMFIVIVISHTCMSQTLSGQGSSQMFSKPTGLLLAHMFLCSNQGNHIWKKAVSWCVTMPQTMLKALHLALPHSKHKMTALATSMLPCQAILSLMSNTANQPQQSWKSLDTIFKPFILLWAKRLKPSPLGCLVRKIGSSEEHDFHCFYIPCYGMIVESYIFLQSL